MEGWGWALLHQQIGVKFTPNLKVRSVQSDFVVVRFYRQVVMDQKSNSLSPVRAAPNLGRPPFSVWVRQACERNTPCCPLPCLSSMLSHGRGHPSGAARKTDRLAPPSERGPVFLSATVLTPQGPFWCPARAGTPRLTFVNLEMSNRNVHSPCGPRASHPPSHG